LAAVAGAAVAASSTLELAPLLPPVLLVPDADGDVEAAGLDGLVELPLAGHRPLLATPLLTWLATGATSLGGRPALIATNIRAAGAVAASVHAWAVGAPDPDPDPEGTPAGTPAGAPLGAPVIAAAGIGSAGDADGDEAGGVGTGLPESPEGADDASGAPLTGSDGVPAEGAMGREGDDKTGRGGAGTGGAGIGSGNVSAETLAALRKTTAATTTTGMRPNASRRPARRPRAKG
jgi:hypothetical protein